MHRYSHRLPWTTPTNAFSKLLAAKLVDGSPLLDLTVSNPSQIDLQYPHREIANTYGSIRDFTYRPEPFGSTEARRAIVRYYESRGVQIHPKQVALTASTSEAYSLLFKLLCNPGDEILVPTPSYPLFDYLAALESVRVVPYRLVYDGRWFIDFDRLKTNLTPRTRAIVVVNPNNPTGSYLERAEANSLLSLASQHYLPIISDEVFMDYSFGGLSSRVSTFAEFDSVLSFSLNGISKTAGMPQLKLGWIVTNGPVHQQEIALDRLEILLDTYLSVSNPVQQSLPRLMELGDSIRNQLKARIAENFEIGCIILKDTAANFLHIDGGWSALIRLPEKLSEEEWITRLLLDHAVVVQPGYFFDIYPEAHIVVSLIAKPSDFRAGLERLRALLNVLQ